MRDKSCWTECVVWGWHQSSICALLLVNIDDVSCQHSDITLHQNTVSGHSGMTQCHVSHIYSSHSVTLALPQLFVAILWRCHLSNNTSVNSSITSLHYWLCYYSNKLHWFPVWIYFIVDSAIFQIILRLIPALFQYVIDSVISNINMLAT